MNDMKRVLITGANSYVGTNIENWLKKTPEEFLVDTVDTFDDHWKKADFTKYDAVFHVAGIAHVDAKPSMEPVYRKVNTDLTLEIARYAKAHGVKQFVFMSSMIVFHESKSLKPQVLTAESQPAPNGFYGDSKLQAEIGLRGLEDGSFRVAILRPPMIYGPGSKGNFLRLCKLATVTPVFPALHNKRSMLYIDNLAEFVKQTITRELSGTFYPQDRELADTVEIAKTFAEMNDHKLFVWKWLNVFVYLGSPVVNALNKMFATYYYDPAMSQMDFDYQVVSQEEAFKRMDITDASLKHMK